MMRPGRVLFMDLDNNGAEETIARMIMLGADPAVLADKSQFRHCAPEDAGEVMFFVNDCAGWATYAVIDCVGELLPIFGANSDKADDYTRVMRHVAAPLEKGGAAVVLIDHQAKARESRQFGAGGTMAKRRAVSGVSINLVAKQTFTPGEGGSAELWINKDRPGGLAKHCPRPSNGGRRRFAGTFILDPPGPTGRADWRVTTERVADQRAFALDPFVERHYTAAQTIGGAFTVRALAVRTNGLPDDTAITETMRKSTTRVIEKLVAQGRFEAIGGTSPKLWRLPDGGSDDD